LWRRYCVAAARAASPLSAPSFSPTTLRTLREVGEMSEAKR